MRVTLLFEELAKRAVEGSAGGEAGAADDADNRDDGDARLLRFTDIPRACFPAGASLGERTRHGMDRSLALRALLAAAYGGDPYRLLGELQFAFVCFIVGQVFDAFEHWKAMLSLVCSCDDAVGAAATQPFYFELLAVLQSQLQEVPEDFFVDLVSPGDNFLLGTLQRLFGSIRDLPPPAADDAGSGNAEKKRLALQARAEKLVGFLRARFGWEFEDDDEPDDEAPVIVDLA